MKHFVDFLRKYEYGLNGKGIVISSTDCRLSSISKKSTKLLYQFIGSDDLWSHLCIILTHCSPYQDDLDELKRSMTSSRESLKSKIIQLIKGISRIKEDPQIPFFFVNSTFWVSY